ncbi:MAG: enoyl-CoA hydratase/isomerase family protein, partial [Promethearchaeota archaeon]
NVRVIVITGAGKAFCAGADVQEFASAELSKAIRKSKFSSVIVYFKISCMVSEKGNRNPPDLNKILRAF